MDDECLAVGAAAGLSERVVGVLGSRGVTTADGLRRFLGPAVESIHDPRLLPDAGAALARVARARERGERVLVYGDFDADGLTGLSILVLSLQELGLDAAPYAPERLGDGHGLSLRAVDLAAAEGRTLIVTADCGSSSEAEIAVAGERGIDVIVTDHHRAPSWPASAVAVVNPHRPDGTYPDRDLTGAGVAWKVAQLLLGELEGPGGGTPPDFVLDLADLALIGTVADVAPLLGENRAIAVLGLERLRRGARPGLAALMARAGVDVGRASVEDIAFAIAPRLNAAGRVGEAARSARLLLARSADDAAALAEEIEAANIERRGLTRVCLEQARAALGLSCAVESTAGSAEGDGSQIGRDEPSARGDASVPSALVVRGDWPIGIIGLIAGRLAESEARPAVVAAPIDEQGTVLRGSCRGASDWDLAEAVAACGDLLERHGGHAAAAGFDILAARWPEFERRFLELAATAPRRTGARQLDVDLVLPAGEVDYELVRELSKLEPVGTGNPAPTLCLTGFRVARARSANGGHTQLVLRRARDVLDAVAFHRPDLAATLREGDRIDVVARAASRRFGGFESIQLEVLDVDAEGANPVVGALSAGDVRPATSRGPLPA